VASYVIGCDVGSQSLKVILMDEFGQTRASASRDYPIMYPRPTWAEQDANAWMQALEGAMAELLAVSGVDPASIKAFGLDGYVDAVVPVDEHGTPLRPAFLWMDRRAVRECEEMAAHVSEEQLFAATGLNLDASHVAPKLLWVKNNEPAVWARTHKFLMPASFVVFHLTGALAVDYSNASSWMLMDVRTKSWSPELFSAFGLEINHAVEIRPAVDVAGLLTEAAARRLGLRPGIPVTVGSGDEHAACVGAGVTVPGLVCDIGGTAEPVCAAADSVSFDETRLVETHCHAEASLWLMENPGFVSGANLRWLRDHFGWQEAQAAKAMGLSSYDLLGLQAAQAPAGSEGLIFIPAMMGAMTPEWNANARGAFVGLTMGHTRAHVVRSVLEASAYGLKDILDRMIAMGIPAKEIRLVGGQAKSALWNQIKADVTGVEVAVPAEAESTALGAAMFAAVTAGFFRNLTDAAATAVRIVERRQPDEKAHAMYQKTYAIYREAYAGLKSTFEKAAQLL